MTQIVKVAKALAKNTKANSGRGVTVAQLVKSTGLTKDRVYRSIYDLRNEGFDVESEYRVVNKKRKLYYHIAS